MPFEYGLQYEAKLQIIPDDEYLCGGVNDTAYPSEGEDSSMRGEGSYDLMTSSGGNIEERIMNEVFVQNMNKIGNNTVDDHVVPSGGVPGKFQVALYIISMKLFHSMLYVH